MDDNDISPEVELTIRRLVSEQIQRIISISSAIGVFTVLGGIYFIATNAATATVEKEINDLDIQSQMSEVLIKIADARAQLRSEVSDARSQLEAEVDGIAKIQQQTGPLIQTVEMLSENIEAIIGAEPDKIERVAKLISTVEENDEIVNAINENGNNLRSMKGYSLKAYVGKSCAEQVPWEECRREVCGDLSTRAGRLEIQFREANFTEKPTVFVSQEGVGSWTNRGLQSIYNGNPNSFELFAYNEDLEAGESYAEYANRLNHCINFVAFGR